MARMPSFKNPPPSGFAFKANDNKLRELLMQWWPSIVSAQQLKDHGPDQRGFIIGGERL